jgi:hypothetical protein
MAIKIGYCPWFEKNHNTTNTALNYYGWAELATLDLEPLDTWDNSTARFLQCPAVIKYIKNTYVLKNTVDLELTWDKNNSVISSNLPHEASNAMIRTHWGDFDPVNGRPIVAISNSFVLVADQPVYVDFFPAFNDIDPSWRLIPGTYNIHSWQRPILPTIELLQDKVIIKRGQPMAYLRFRSEDPKDSFSLQKIERTDKLEHVVNSCLTLKHYMPKLSWKIHNAINKIRPKKWL